MGINCSIFLYRKVDHDQRLALLWKSFRILNVQFSGSSSRGIFCSNGFDTIHVMCTDLLCVAFIGLLLVCKKALGEMERERK